MRHRNHNIIVWNARHPPHYYLLGWSKSRALGWVILSSWRLLLLSRDSEIMQPNARLFYHPCAYLSWLNALKPTWKGWYLWPPTGPKCKTWSEMCWLLSVHCIVFSSILLSLSQLMGGLPVPSRKDRGVMNLALDQVPELDFQPLCDSILGLRTKHDYKPMNHILFFWMIPTQNLVPPKVDS